jgi:hypothetical protein
MRAAEHDPHRQTRFVGVAGAQGFERLDRGLQAAFAVFGLVEDRRGRALPSST